MFEIATWTRNPWSVFDELESLQSDMSRMVSGAGNGRLWRRARPAYPLMNVWSSAEGLVVDAELPGVDPKDVEITVQADELVLSGKVNVQEPQKDECVCRKERPSGQFSRTLQLPFRANAAGVKASYRNGVLRISIPRSEEEKPKKIAVEAA